MKICEYCSKTSEVQASARNFKGFLANARNATGFLVEYTAEIIESGAPIDEGHIGFTARIAQEQAAAIEEGERALAYIDDVDCADLGFAADDCSKLVALGLVNLGTKMRLERAVG